MRTAVVAEGAGRAEQRWQRLVLKAHERAAPVRVSFQGQALKVTMPGPRGSRVGYGAVAVASPCLP